MAAAKPEKLTVEAEKIGRVSALLSAPSNAEACFVFAHGAGAGMNHSFMAAVAEGLADRRIASLRYQFLYMEKGSKRPDPPAVAHAVVRAAVSCAGSRLPGLPLVAGGKSFGGRMTSQAQAASPMPNVRGLAFFGFPLHPAGKPSIDRAAHLSQVAVPMLFLQGTQDKLADLNLLEPMISALGTRATLRTFAGADHSFHVPKRSGTTDAEVMTEALDAFASWCKAIRRRA